MNSWKITYLSEVCELIPGFAFKSKDFGDYPLKVIKIAQITPPNVDMENLIGVNIENYDTNKLEKFYASKDDYVLAMTGATIGKIGRIKQGSAYINQRVLKFKSKDNIDSDFLYYVLQQYNFAQYVKTHIDSESAQPNISATTIGKYELAIPPYALQKQIGSFLRKLDDKIALNQQINKNLEEQAQAIYMDMLCENDCKAVELQELCTFQEGYVNPPQGNTEYFDGEVKWLRAVDINESYIINTSRTLTQEGFDSAKKSALLFEPDTIAISKSGTIGRLGVIGDYMCGNRAVINIKPKQKEMLPFIYLYLKSRQREFAELAVGSVQKNLYVSLLEPLIVMIPKKDVLQSFSETADRQFEMIKRNCLENERLSQVRDALLPRLMSGEIDVSGLEI